MRSVIRVLAAALATVALWSAAPVNAQSADAKLAPPVIALLDMRVVMRESHAGKAWQAYYNSKVKQHKDNIAAEEKALRPAWEELQRQRAIMAPQAFQQREREFREKEAAVNRKIAGAEQEMTIELRSTSDQVRHAIEEKLRPIRDRIVAERGIDIIFLASPDLSYVSKPYDITPIVLERLNKSLPKLDVRGLAKKAKKK